MRPYSTEPVTVTLTGENFSGVMNGHITYNQQSQPTFRAHEEVLCVGNTVEVIRGGVHAYGNRELSRGDVGTVELMNRDVALVRFWRHPELVLDIPVSCLRYVKP